VTASSVDGDDVASTTATIDVDVTGVADAPTLSATVGEASGNTGQETEVQVNTETAGDQKNSTVTALDDGGYVVVWESEDQDGNDEGIFGQRYDANGTPVGGEFQVNTETNDKQEKPNVTALNDGGFVVVWESEDQDGDDAGVFGQRYDANGEPVGGEFQVNSETDGDQKEPQVTALEDGGYVVVWETDDPNKRGPDGGDGDGSGIFGQRYDANGDPVGGEFQVNSESEGDQQNAQVTALADGGYVVVWESEDQDGSGDGVYGQRYDANGDPVGGEFQANTTTSSDQGDPHVTALDDGGYVVVWESKNQDGNGQGVFGQRYDADGNPVDGEFQVNTETLNNQENPQVTALDDGGYMVVWESKNQDGSGEGVYGQRYGADGNPVGGEVQINTQTNGNQNNASVTVLSSGNIVVSWESENQDGDGDGVFSRMIDLDPDTTEIPLTIELSGGDTDGSESISVTIDGVPSGASLSAGTDNGDGTWTLTSDDLNGLTITPADGDETDIDLTITAQSSEGGGVATTTATVAVQVGDEDISFDQADTLFGGDGEDILYGGDGIDTLYGGDGADTLYGEAGDDIMVGGMGDDTMLGGSGDDLFLLSADGGNDTVIGGDGTDTMDISAMAADQSWTVTLDDGSSISGSGADYLELTNESSGTLTFDDGTEVKFEGLETITW